MKNRFEYSKLVNNLWFGLWVNDRENKYCCPLIINDDNQYTLRMEIFFLFMDKQYEFLKNKDFGVSQGMLWICINGLLSYLFSNCEMEYFNKNCTEILDEWLMCGTYKGKLLYNSLTF